VKETEREGKQRKKDRTKTPREDEQIQFVPYVPRPRRTQFHQELACSTEGQPEQTFHPFQRLNKYIVLKIFNFLPDRTLANLRLTSKRIHYRLTPAFWDRPVNYKCPEPTDAPGRRSLRSPKYYLSRRCAAANRHANIVGYLLKMSSDPNKKDGKHLTPLIRAG